jgi:VWFA-related protein
MRQTESNLSPYAGCVMCAALLSFLALPLGAQTGAAGATGLKIRTETRLVLVDAVVTAKQDEPVGGLTAKDFHVFEDGREQPITAFQMHSGPAAAGVSQIQHVVLLFDARSSDDSMRIAQAARKFAADNAGPNRLISVAYYDAGRITVVTQFTADVGELQRALVVWPATSRVSEESDDPQGLVRAHAFSQFARDLAKVPGHKVVALFVGRAMRFGSEGRQSQVADAMHQIREGSGDVLTDADGMQLEFRKADASVYTVEGQSGARAPGWALALAEKTGGGELSRANAAAAAFALLAREQDQAYTLGYVPADSPQGSCHKLKVTVDRPDLKVRGRDLYCNVPEVAPPAARTPETKLETLAPGAANVAASASLPFFYEPGGVARVNLALEIPAPVFHPAPVSGRLQASLEVLGLTYDAAGGVVARFSDTAKYSFDDRRQFDEFARQPLYYEHEFRVAPGDYKFKLTFLTAKDRFGAIEIPLAIDPLDPAELALSPIALGWDARPISPEAAQAEADAGKRPLVFQGKRITLSATGRLSKTGAAEACFEIYQPPADGAAPAKLTMRARVFDAPGTAQKWDSGDVDLSGLASAAGGAIPVAVKLPVATLEPGAYRAKITVTDADGNEASQSVQFQVE